jgi:hypothetical protein
LGLQWFSAHAETFFRLLASGIKSRSEIAEDAMNQPILPPSAIQAGVPVARPATAVAVALEQIQVASPCHAAWDAMTGNDQVRFCGQCSKHVYNLSGMSRADAEALVSATEGRMCVRFFRRADGTVLTQDCPVGLRAVRRRMLLWCGAAAAILFAFLGLVTTITAGAVGVGWANGWRPRPLVWVVELLVPGAPPVIGGGPREPIVMGDMCPPDRPIAPPQ